MKPKKYTDEEDSINRGYKHIYYAMAFGIVNIAFFIIAVVIAHLRK